MGMAAILIKGPWPSLQIFNPLLTEDSTWKLAQGSQKLSRSKVWTTDNRRTMDDDRQRTASGHNSSSWAFSSDELKKTECCLQQFSLVL